mgnify:CR=1 FL=1
MAWTEAKGRLCCITSHNTHAWTQGQGTRWGTTRNAHTAANLRWTTASAPFAEPRERHMQAHTPGKRTRTAARATVRVTLLNIISGYEGNVKGGCECDGNKSEHGCVGADGSPLGDAAFCGSERRESFCE